MLYIYLNNNKVVKTDLDIGSLIGMMSDANYDHIRIYRKIDSREQDYLNTKNDEVECCIDKRSIDLIDII